MLRFITGKIEWNGKIGASTAPEMTQKTIQHYILFVWCIPIACMRLNVITYLWIKPYAHYSMTDCFNADDWLPWKFSVSMAVLMGFSFFLLLFTFRITNCSGSKLCKANFLFCIYVNSHRRCGTHFWRNLIEIWCGRLSII